MDRTAAYALVHSRLGDSHTFAHCLATEACMRALAGRLGQDVDLWGVTGLVHDLDLDVCQDDLSQHAEIGARVLEAAGAPAEMVHAVRAHNDKAPRESLLDHGLWVVDPTTGFITAAALIRPSRSTRDLSVSSVRKRMKEQRFAAAVNRDQIRACEPLLGLDLDTFLGLCIGAMDGIRDAIGLGGTPQA
ncbi:MAG: HDIG domain-containing protein [Deltaproteobacteria bacterium]|nr:HDIG domain-containing protein [Deltaproteobacteria bacterium]